MNKNNMLSWLVCCALLFFAFSGPVMGKGNRLEMSGLDIFQDTRSGLMWRLERSPRLKSFDEVQQYLRELNANDRYHDWRLPVRRELYELITVFDLKDNGGIQTDTNGKYWILDDNGAPRAGGWESGEGCGPARKFFAGRAGYVRAVRP